MSSFYACASSDGLEDEQFVAGDNRLIDHAVDSDRFALALPNRLFEVRSSGKLGRR